MERGHDNLDTPGLSEILPSVLTALEEFLGGLEHAPADGADTSKKVKTVGEPPNDEPTDLSQLLDTIGAAASVAVETAGPRYFGYIPGGGVVSSAVGELVARTLNRYTSLADLAPGLVTLEDGVLRWLASVFDLPAGANGLLTTGGSQAMLSMMLAAREHHFGEGDFSRGRIYLSDQAHHCVRKAARIVGFPRSAVRVVPTSDGRRIDPTAAEAAIAQDRADGFEPFLLIGTAGTTNAGTVDPLNRLASLARGQDLWFHVDGCYGGFFQLTERGRTRLAGVERADSITLDPHKSLFLPYGTGALLVRDPAVLAAAHSDDAPGEYLQDLSDTDLPDYAHLGTELTREHRGLRLWLPLHLHGVGAFRAALDEKLDLARHAHDVLTDHPALDVPESPELSTVVFRLPDGDEANRALLRSINDTGRVFCSSTRLDGLITLRLCVLSHRTHHEHLDETLDVIHAQLPRAQDLDATRHTRTARKKNPTDQPF